MSDGMTQAQQANQDGVLRAMLRRLHATRKAQNRVRRQYGIGRTQLLARMNAHYSTLLKFCFDATWEKPVDCDTKDRVHWLIDSLAADSIIATAYREAEEAARASG